MSKPTVHIRALRKWKMDLIESEFYVYTDHKTLLNFNTQKDLSSRQARWIEELAIYNCKFVYVKGKENSAADALSRYPHTLAPDLKSAEKKAQHPYIYSTEDRMVTLINSVNPLHHCVNVLSNPNSHLPNTYELKIHNNLINELKDAYKTDKWCQTSKGMPDLNIRDGLWFMGKRLIIPDCKVREYIFATAHDTLGHFGFSKTYESIRESYFWPNMRTDLEEGDIPSCIETKVRRLNPPVHYTPYLSLMVDATPLPWISSVRCLWMKM